MQSLGVEEGGRHWVISGVLPAQPPGKPAEYPVHDYDDAEVRRFNPEGMEMWVNHMPPSVGTWCQGYCTKQGGKYAYGYIDLSTLEGRTARDMVLAGKLRGASEAHVGTAQALKTMPGHYLHVKIPYEISLVDEGLRGPGTEIIFSADQATLATKLNDSISRLQTTENNTTSVVNKDSPVATTTSVLPLLQQFLQREIEKGSSPPPLPDMSTPATPTAAAPAPAPVPEMSAAPAPTQPAPAPAPTQAAPAPAPAPTVTEALPASQALQQSMDAMLQQPNVDVGEVWKRLMNQHSQDCTPKELASMSVALSERLEKLKQEKLQQQKEMERLRGELAQAKSQEQTVQSSMLSDIAQKRQDALGSFGAVLPDDAARKELADSMEGIVPTVGTGTSLTDLAKQQRFFAGLARAGSHVREQMALGKRQFDEFRQHNALAGDAAQPPEKGLKALNAELGRLAGAAPSLNPTGQRFNPAQFAGAAAAAASASLPAQPAQQPSAAPAEPAKPPIQNALWAMLASGNLGNAARKVGNSNE